VCGAEEVGGGDGVCGWEGIWGEDGVMGEGGISNGLRIKWLYVCDWLSWEVFVLLVLMLFAERRALQQSCR
jgi:hypothetical protein